MRNHRQVAGIASIVVGLAGIAWVYLVTRPPALGFEDTDDPSVMLRFAFAHADVYVRAGMAMLAMGVALIVASVGLAEVMRDAVDRMALRCVTAFGGVAATFVLLTGALYVQASGPLLHVAGLRTDWGESAFIAFNVGSQAMGIVGLAMLCTWALGVSALGLRSKTLPGVLGALAILPATRLLGGILGPLDLLPSGAWLLTMLAIPGTFIWCLGLGTALLRGARGSSTEPVVGRAAAGA